MTPSVINGESYVLATAAYNEEALIEKVITSVCGQTVPPKKWVLVSDGSSDRTDEIVQRYASEYPFIELLRVHEEHARDFAAQVNAINLGFAQLAGLEYSFIGNLDADVVIEPTYFARLIEKLGRNPRLGLAGGSILEQRNGRFQARRTNNPRAVAHAVQFFRRECFETIGEYVALKYGGPDWHAELIARMNGWEVQSFDDLEVHHLRPTGTADKLLKHVFRQGRMDYSLGSYAPFELLKCMKRLREKPWIIGGLARFGGFLWSACVREKREASPEVVRFLRNEQKRRTGFFLSGRISRPTVSA